MRDATRLPQNAHTRERNLIMRIYALAVALAAAILALTLCTEARADTVGIHVASNHWPNDGKNNFNPGVYYVTDNKWSAGVYLNSYNRVSLYGARTFETPRWHGFTAALTVGAVTGYPAGDLLPMAMPSVSGPVPTTEVRWRLGFAPKLHPKQSATVMHLMFEYPF